MHLPCPGATHLMGRQLLLGHGLFVIIVSVAFEVMSVLASPALCFEVNDANFASLVVCNSHIADVLDVHGAKDQVLNMGARPVDGEVFSSALQVDVLEADRLCLKGTDAKPHLSMRLHLELIMLRVSMACRDRRVMTDLFADVLELRTEIFVGLA